ncbi:MAG: hypothetical protein LBF68_08730 [Christensenellaceae bacterium]|jgi:hypothetical protein|nr:hypothetical protein [Christensenellaceae bacterium]
MGMLYSSFSIISEIDLFSDTEEVVAKVLIAKRVQHQILFFKWTTTEYRYTRYLRVIDGWDSSNSSRFIDFSGYWDSILGWSVNIYG